MDVQEIEVFIDKDGKVRIEVRGVEGMQCLELTQGLEQALGGEIDSRELTPEAYEQPEENQDRQWLQGGE